MNAEEKTTERIKGRKARYCPEKAKAPLNSAEHERASDPEQSEQGGESDNSAHNVQHVHLCSYLAVENFIRCSCYQLQQKPCKAGAIFIFNEKSIGKFDAGGWYRKLVKKR
jgi:hypothetical protein